MVCVPDDTNYFVKHFSSFLCVRADALVVFASLVVCWAADLAAPLDTVHVCLKSSGLVGPQDNADYFM